MGVLAFVVSVACIGCSSSTSNSPEDSAGIMMRLIPAYSDTVSEYALVEGSTSLPLIVSVESLGLADRFVDARIGNDHKVELGKLTRDASLLLTLTDKDGRQRNVTVHMLPADFPPYDTQTSSGVAAGRIDTGLFTGFADSSYSYALLLNADGSPSYFRRFDHPIFNFHQVKYGDGRVRYAYLESFTGFDVSKGAAEGDIVLLDERFHEIRRFRLLPTSRHGAIPAENHDVIVFDDDHVVLSAYDARTVDLTAYGGRTDSKVVAAVLQEIRGGQLVWEWDSTDYPQLYAASMDGNDYSSSSRVADYLHFNAIEFDPADEGYLVSFRHLDSIIKILPRSVPLGSPVPMKWILGGKLDQFRLGPEQRFYHQHDVRIVSRQGSQLTISLFNNNNGHYGEHPTSAMVMTLDEPAKGARVDDEYWDQMQSTSQGSVQVLGPRHYFICWGSDNQITEVNQGVKVFTLKFANNLIVYRAHKSP
jgi:hypothetical protein